MMELVLGILVTVATGLWAYSLGWARGEEAVRREQDQQLADRFPDQASLDDWISDWIDGFGTKRVDP